MSLVSIEAELAKLLPKAVPQVLAKGTVQAPSRGWFRALYYDPLTGSEVTFSQPPTIVAIAELREGTPPKVTAPTITIPTLELPKASTIDIPRMSLPSATPISVPSVQIPKSPTIEIPTVTIAYLNESFPYYSPGQVCFFGACQPINVELADNLNKVTKSLYAIQTRANDVIATINDGLKKIREATISVRDALFDFRDKVQTAVNEYKDKIQTAVNSGFSDTQTKTQEALNAYRDKIQTGVNSGLTDIHNKTQEALNTYRQNIQKAVNDGLSNVIPKLYEMVGMPVGQLMSPINIRNVTESSFEFYSLSPGLKLHYIAIAKR